MRALRSLLAVLALLVGAAMPALAQSPFGPAGTPYHYLTGASTNAQVVKPSPGTAWLALPINTTTTLYYLKFYDTASTPSCNSTAVQMTVPIPFGTGSSGSGAVIPVPIGIRFQNGIAFCVTGGIADNDNTAAAAGLVINLVYQ